MKPASNALKKSMGQRLTAAYAAAGKTCGWSVNPDPLQSMPYGVLGNDSDNGNFGSKDTHGGLLTHTLRIYSISDAEARELASIAIADIMDEAKPLQFEPDGNTVFYQAGRVQLELFEVLPEIDDRGARFGAAIRFRLFIGQYES